MATVFKFKFGAQSIIRFARGRQAIMSKQPSCAMFDVWQIHK